MNHRRISSISCGSGSRRSLIDVTLVKPAPAGTPRDIVNKIDADVVQFLARPYTAAKMSSKGAILAGSMPGLAVRHAVITHARRDCGRIDFPVYYDMEQVARDGRWPKALAPHAAG